MGSGTIRDWELISSAYLQGVLAGTTSLRKSNNRDDSHNTLAMKILSLVHWISSSVRVTRSINPLGTVWEGGFYIKNNIVEGLGSITSF